MTEYPLAQSYDDVRRRLDVGELQQLEPDESGALLLADIAEANLSSVHSIKHSDLTGAYALAMLAARRGLTAVLRIQGLDVAPDVHNPAFVLGAVTRTMLHDGGTDRPGGFREFVAMSGAVARDDVVSEDDVEDAIRVAEALLEQVFDALQHLGPWADRRLADGQA